MNGFLPMYKPTGMTSADVVYKLRKIVHMKRIGHSGTLDPNVDGMLPVALGVATKAITVLQDGGKVYTGEVTLGFATTTEDLDGEVVERTPLTAPVPTPVIDETMATFLGTITQIPPMYSAVKVNGRRLYEYARAGETVERPERKALIKAFTRTSDPVFDAENGTQKFTFEAQVGKGTYIRTLAVDLGRRLGYAACMSQLTRQVSGGFDRQQAVTLEEVTTAVENNRLADLVVPVQHAYRDLPAHELTATEWRDIQDGRFLKLPLAGSKLRLELDGVLKAVYQWDDGIQIYRPDTMYLSNDFGGVTNEDN